MKKGDGDNKISLYGAGGRNVALILLFETFRKKPLSIPLLIENNSKHITYLSIAK